MEIDRSIGRVLNIDSFRVVIEINKENKSLTKTHYTGICPVARINSYVIIPVGYEKIVGHVTKVQMFSESTELKNKATITLPDVKRLVWATMIGTIKRKGEEEFYEQGITSYPCLDNPVYFILKDELDCIFDKQSVFDKEEYKDITGRKYYIPVGKSTAFSEYEVKVDPDALFGKHLAVLGNTGSGKSCTIASLIQTILNNEFEGKKINNAHFVIFDTNGEYSETFLRKNKKGEIIENLGDSFCIDKEGLKIPYWFMNFEDFKTLFRATEGTQSPVLNTSLVLAKGTGAGKNPTTSFIILSNYLKSLYDNLIETEQWWKPKNIYTSSSLLLNKIEKSGRDLEKYFKSLDFDIEISQLFEIVEKIKNSIDVNGKSFSYKPDFESSSYIKWYEERRDRLESFISSFEVADFKLDVDMPKYFDKTNFFKDYLYPAMNIQGREVSRIREYCSTLILRMTTLFKDERYKILFDDYKKFPFALATFLRYCFGRMEGAKFKEFEKDESEEPPFLDYYLTELEKLNHKRKESEISGVNHQIVIFDLSLIVSDILENITALLGRLILEFLQRMGKKKEDRGKFPVVLILEEAHNYIPEKKRNEDNDSISKIIFERIAREGRKYGLSLVVSSQRPSELSKTVLSQCNSFVVHRVQNPEDQYYIRTIVPSINEDLLKQLPSLAQRTALIFGDCVRAPAQIYMNEANPRPASTDPRFMEHWLNIDGAGIEPDFEGICREWEGGTPDGGGDSGVEDEQEAS